MSFRYDDDFLHTPICNWSENPIDSNGCNPVSYGFLELSGVYSGIISLRMDIHFSFTQNVSGRTLVGLRFWNQVGITTCPAFLITYTIPRLTMTGKAIGFLKAEMSVTSFIISWNFHNINCVAIKTCKSNRFKVSVRFCLSWWSLTIVRQCQGCSG